MDQNNAVSTQREAEWRERRNKRQNRTTGSPGTNTTATKKPFASSARWQRAQWAVVMCLPCFLLFFLRLLSKEGSLKHIHLLDNWLALPLDASMIQTDMTSTIYATCALLASIIVAINELKGNSRIPVYFYVFTCAMSWGSCIDLLEDLVLARLCCMGVFGIGAGQLWFLWDRHIAKKKLHYQRLERKRAENIHIKGGIIGGVVDDGHNASSQSDEGGPTSGPEASPIVTTATVSPPNNDGEDSAPVSPLWRTMQPQSPSGQEIAHWLWGKMGLAALWSLGEVLGCLMFVNHSYQFIGSSLLGYPLLVIFPILCARAAMGLSWVLTLLIGKSHAYSATILRALHVVFTVFVLVILLGGFIKCISHYLPWVWSLQKLVGPYCLVIENISYNSRKYHSKNPYKDFVDQHRDSIAHFFTKSGKAAH